MSEGYVVLREGAVEFTVRWIGRGGGVSRMEGVGAVWEP